MLQLHAGNILKHIYEFYIMQLLCSDEYLTIYLWGLDTNEQYTIQYSWILLNRHSKNRVCVLYEQEH